MSLDELFENSGAIDEALREAARDARRFDKALGYFIGFNPACLRMLFNVTRRDVERDGARVKRITR